MLLLSFVSFAQPDSHTPMWPLLSVLASTSASLPNCDVICTVIVIPDEEKQHPTYSTVSYQADIHKPRNGMIPLAVNANDTLAKVWFSLQLVKSGGMGSLVIKLSMLFKVYWVFFYSHSGQIAIIRNLRKKFYFNLWLQTIQLLLQQVVLHL